MLNEPSNSVHVCLSVREAGVGCRKMRQKAERVALGVQPEVDRTSSIIVWLRVYHNTFNQHASRCLEMKSSHVVVQHQRVRLGRSSYRHRLEAPESMR